MKPVTRTVRVGSNRGKPRLWLEGQWLADLGFPRGTRFVAAFTDAAITLTTRESDVRNFPSRTVSGKGDRPIIDIAGASLLPWVGATLSLVGRPGLITIRRAQ